MQLLKVIGIPITIVTIEVAIAVDLNFLIPFIGFYYFTVFPDEFLQKAGMNFRINFRMNFRMNSSGVQKSNTIDYNYFYKLQGRRLPDVTRLLREFEVLNLSNDIFKQFGLFKKILSLWLGEFFHSND